METKKIIFFQKIPGILNTKLAHICIKTITLYQKTISPDHGPSCRNNPFYGCKFHPSCSEYSVQVLKKYGFFPGILKIIWRVLRCNPWNKGGLDKP